MSDDPKAELVAPLVKASTFTDRRASQRKLLVVFCALSLGIHVGLFVGWALAPKEHKVAIDLDKNVVKTRLVKLGKPRDEKLLPRLPTSPPPPTAPTKAPPPTETITPPKPAPEAVKQPSAADVLDRFNKDNAKPTSVKDIIKNRIGEETDEGKADGDIDGTDLTGEIEASYFNRVTAHLKRFLKPSNTLTDEERVSLRAELLLVIDADGNIVTSKIQHASGSERFDNDVIEAAQRANPAPAPPPQVRALAASGIGFNMCPVACN